MNRSAALAATQHGPSLHSPSTATNKSSQAKEPKKTLLLLLSIYSSLPELVKEKMLWDAFFFHNPRKKP